MSDIHDSWVSLGMCDCREFCSRWWYNENTDTGGFCPYVPENNIHDTNNCKALKGHIFKMKMTIIKKDENV